PLLFNPLLNSIVNTQQRPQILKPNRGGCKGFRHLCRCCDLILRGSLRARAKRNKIIGNVNVGAIFMTTLSTLEAETKYLWHKYYRVSSVSCWGGKFRGVCFNDPG